MARSNFQYEFTRARRLSSRCLRVAVALIAISLFGTLPTAETAHAAKYAAFVIDAKSGKTLFARNADKARYPASLTKMMTLYIVFEMLKQKRIKLETPLKVSSYASSRPPSKLGLKRGQTIRVIDAIRALITKSANDVATAVAENLGGSEARFAQTMTQTARELGMLKTTFRNASGLPNWSQRSTARDMATLGLALIDHHPYYYRYFKTRRFTYRGRRYRNHNSLLYNFNGTDGIKTGYTRASGFNLVASVRRGRKHVVGVVMGGATAGKRNAHMRSILRTALGKSTNVASRRKTAKGTMRLANLRPSPRRTRVARASIPTPRRVKNGVTARSRTRAPRAIPANRQIVKVGPVAVLAPKPRPRLRPTITDDQRIRLAALTVPTPVRSHKGTTITSLAELGLTANSVRAFMTRQAVMTNDELFEAEQAYARRLQLSQTRQPEPVQQASFAPRERYAARTIDTHHVQIGSYGSAGEAEAALNRARRSNAQLLGQMRGVTTIFEAKKRRYYRARFAGFDASSARRVCSTLKARRIDCIVMRAN